MAPASTPTHAQERSHAFTFSPLILSFSKPPFATNSTPCQLPQAKVRLLRKEELPADWDPARDSRLTVWEATHHLIRALDSGEQAAAALLKKLGPLAEVARDLSYRLYTVCERRKWAQEAIGYNALVLSWSDLKRQADEQRDLGPAQRELI
jgi:putative DNA methylase